MNPYNEDVSETNFWLPCMIINPEAMCKPVRGECEVLYVSELGKVARQKFLKNWLTFYLETDAYASNLSDEWIYY